MTSLIVVWVLSQSPTMDAEVFVDRGETYIRAGANNGLQVGNGLEILDSKGRQPVGSGAVMEVWESLSRISLDSKGAAHVGLKVVRVSKPLDPASQDFYANAAPRPAPKAAPSAPPPPPPVPAPAAAPAPAPPAVATSPATPQATPQGAGLVGYATANGAGDLRRIVIYNNSQRDWHECDLRLSNNRHFRMGDLEKGENDGVMLFRFEYDGAPAWPAFAGVTVICREGVGRFNLTL